jgi:autotransporter-associated beta strand protein
VNPKFDGGTLKSSTAGTANNDFSITANGGGIDANGTALVFSGVISNDAGATGAMTIKNTGVGGAITFSAANTYTGATTVDAGGTLKRSGAGSVATSSGVSNDGTFEIQGTTAGASVKSMTGAGGTTLGSKTLTLTTATGTYSGVMSGTGGGLAISGGAQTLTGINTYTGATSISSGATVALSGNGSIEGSSGLANDGTFSISAKTTSVSIAGITGSGATTLGANTLTFTNASGTYSGVMAGTGGLTLSGGNQTLAGVNTFTGATGISSGATVTLSGSGSVAASSGLSNGGTFSIVGTTSGASIKSMTGAGTTALGSKTLTLTTATGDYSGVMAGTGGLTLSGGSQTLSGVNTFTGATSISGGTTVTLSGAGSVAGSSGISNAGTFNIAGTTSGASIKSMTGAGATTLGSKTLTLSNATGTYSGVMAGTGGGLAVTGGATTLTGSNTFTGATSIGSGATVTLSGSGSIAGSSGLENNGALSIAATTNGATIATITGSGSTSLGSKTLTLANAAGDYSGAINGTGGITLVAGTQTLSGTNTYSGITEVRAGATLQIASAAALGASSLNLVGTATTSATLSTTQDMTLSNAISVAFDPTFNVAPGTTLTIAAPITDGAAAGDVVVAGGGRVLMTAVNTYSGVTTIDANSTLELSGVGSVANSPFVTNNGSFKISAAANTVALTGNYTQSATGSLQMNWTQKLVVTVNANLAGGLKLTNTTGSAYAKGRYTLISAAAVTGTFAAVDTSSLPTGFKYLLAYDAANVYLDLLTAGPSITATQKSTEGTAAALRSSFALQNTYLVNGFGYDCNRFGNNGACFSAGGQSTSVRTQDNAGVGGQIILAYKINPNVRLGTYIVQSSASQSLGSVKLGSTTPAFGLFAAWNQHADGKGVEIKVSAGQVRKNATITRAVVEDSEAGSGGTNLNSQGAQALLTYAFEAAKDMTISPYAGVRYTQSKMGDYTEATAVGVTAPLAYQAITNYSTTALAGMGAALKLNPQATFHASVGAEKDTNTKNGTYTASSAAIAGLTAIGLNANPQKTRLTASLAAYYDLGSKQRISISAISRQEAYRSAPTRSVFASYTVGF